MKSGLITALGLGSIVGAALLVFGRSSTASAAPRPQPLPSTLTVQDRMAAAIATNNYTAIMNEAAKLRSEGHTDAANALQAAAAEMATRGPGGPAMQAAQNYGRSPGQPTGTPAPIPSTIPVVTVPVTTTQPTDPGFGERKARAERFGLYISTAAKLNADPQVKAFQLQEGLTVDGLYGPKTAVALASYGVIPRKPLYWSRNNWGEQKTAYQATMLDYARKDPARAQQWIEAGNVVVAPKPKTTSKGARA